MDEDEMNRRV